MLEVVPSNVFANMFATLQMISGEDLANSAGSANATRWRRHFEIEKGMRVFARPIRPGDEASLLNLLKHLTAEDTRLRFFATIKGFSRDFVDRLTHLDYSRAMAFVAFDEASNEMVGVVRVHCDPSRKSGEYAVLVRSDLKGRGLGWALMQSIIEYAKSAGLKTLTGEVLQQNSMMLKMCRELGFDLKTSAVDPGVCNVQLAL